MNTSCSTLPSYGVSAATADLAGAVLKVDGDPFGMNNRWTYSRCRGSWRLSIPGHQLTVVTGSFLAARPVDAALGAATSWSPKHDPRDGQEGDLAWPGWLRW